MTENKKRIKEEAKKIAVEVRKRHYRNETYCRDLCVLAGMEKEWYDAINPILEKAAKKLGVCIEPVASNGRPSEKRTAKIIAEDMRSNGWDPDLCTELIRKAGMEDVLTASNIASCDPLGEALVRAAKKLRVNIWR